MRFDRPTELQDFFSYVLLYAPEEYPSEDNYTNSKAFTEMFSTIEYFLENTPSTEGKESIEQVIRNPRVTYEEYEHGNDVAAAHLLQETEAMFQASRKFIRLSDV
jgi:hypothetical protein